VISGVAWAVIRAAMGLRVTPEEEMEGLDIGEHGMTAYPDFVIAAEVMSPMDIGTPSGGARVPGYASRPVHA
jgi:Amt family ammonium transporter